MSVIVKGFGNPGTTILVKGFGGGVLGEIIVKIIWCFSKISKILNLNS